MTLRILGAALLGVSVYFFARCFSRPLVEDDTARYEFYFGALLLLAAFVCWGW